MEFFYSSTFSGQPLLVASPHSWLTPVERRDRDSHHSYLIPSSSTLYPKTASTPNMRLPTTHQQVDSPYTGVRTGLGQIKETHRLLNKERYITNLSSKKINSPQLDVLSLGLTFSPSRDTSSSKLSESLNIFDRSNKLKYFFRKQPLTEPHPFKHLDAPQ